MTSMNAFSDTSFNSVWAFRYKTLGYLHNWLKEYGSDREFSLVHRGSWDVNLIQPFTPNAMINDVHPLSSRLWMVIVGGCSNMPWKSNCSNWAADRDVFLFNISGYTISRIKLWCPGYDTSPYNIQLNYLNGINTVYHHGQHGSTFGIVATISECNDQLSICV